MHADAMRVSVTASERECGGGMVRVGEGEKENG